MSVPLKITNEVLKAKKSGSRRLLVFTPTTGLVRMEWVMARYGQVIPTNWGMMQFIQFVNSFVPIDYQLADAQNLLALKVMEYDVEWVLFIEHDNLIPQDLFIKINRYMLSKKYPVVSALYFTKSNPPEPVLYRGRGNGYFADWKIGDKVMVDGVPFGCLLMHASLIKAAWEESQEYSVGGTITRKVFSQPARVWFDQDKGKTESAIGTTDLEWCSRCINDGLFEKAGWKRFQKMQYPFLVDTSIFVWHIDQNGVKWPLKIPQQFVAKNGYRGKLIT